MYLLFCFARWYEKTGCDGVSASYYLELLGRVRGTPSHVWSEACCGRCRLAYLYTTSQHSLVSFLISGSRLILAQLQPLKQMSIFTHYPVYVARSTPPARGLMHQVTVDRYRSCVPYANSHSSGRSQHTACRACRSCSNIVQDHRTPTLSKRRRRQSQRLLMRF